jgi:peptidoglycan L-alanyl-D-glutamate endopeptidase CwlK
MSNRIDKITLQRIENLHPKVREEVRDLYLNKIVPALTGKAMCRFAFTLRTIEEQNALYAQGRTKLFDASGRRLGIVTKAKGGQSWHQYGLAIDIVLLVDRNNDGVFESASWETKTDFDGDGQADWREVVKIFKDAGWVWGGDWKFVDAPHFEKTFGLTHQECFKRHQAKDFIPGTTWIRI